MHQILSYLLLLSSSLCMAESKPEKSPVILFLGDSVTAGYGVSPGEAYPEILKNRLKGVGNSYEFVNAAESGSLSSSLSSRLRFQLKRKNVYLVVIASGGNDARQKTPADVIFKNLSEAISIAKSSKAKVLLLGMRIFPNLGKEYSDQFAAIYPQLGRKHQVTLLPFLLEGVAGRPQFNQADGFHPNAEGHIKMADLVEPYLRKLM